MGGAAVRAVMFGVTFCLWKTSYWKKSSFFTEKSGAGWARRRFWQQMCDHCLYTSLKLRFWDELLRNFALWEQNLRKSRLSSFSELHRTPCSFTQNFRQVLCGLSLRQDEEHMCGAGNFSITNVGQPSSALSLTKKWLYMFRVYALMKLRNPGQVSKLDKTLKKPEPLTVFGSELIRFTWIYPLLWLSCFWLTM